MTKVAVIGRGLIGGSIEKSARRAGHEAVVFRGRGPTPDLSSFDIVFLAAPPAAICALADAIDAKGSLRDGAVVVDIAGVKRPIYDHMRKFVGTRRWFFVPGHPMAGREKPGYANSCENLFDGASMIITPFPETPESVLSGLESFFRSLGFSMVVRTDPDHHDGMIAFTSQLCHLISSAYVREPLVRDHVGYSAGSFRDMARVGAPDPDTWTELFFANRESLLPVLGRYVERMEDFRDALEQNDRVRMHRALEESVEAKATFGKGLK